MISVCTLCILLVAGVDLWCKWYVERHVKKEHALKHTKGRVLIRRVHNKGMMLNVMDKYPNFVKCISFAATILVLLYQMLLFRRTGNHKVKLGTALIAGGAVSNTYDRIQRGYVVDYIGFQRKGQKLGKVTYNLGDFAIFAGTFLVILGNIFHQK